jgi:glutamate-5-semialdehyde dehydrogenase
MSIEARIVEMARAAKKSAREMACCPSKKKNTVINRIADRLEADASSLMAENEKDLARAQKMGLAPAMIDRLTLNEATIDAMSLGLREVALQKDPVGTMSASTVRPNGLEVFRMRIPLGVIGIIYEARPNVTIDAAGLCLKSGNAVILRGGSEALHSNQALAAVISHVLDAEGLPAAAVQVIPMRDRKAVNVLLRQEAFIDVIIPRGGEQLIRFVAENAQMPVLKHYKGVCHIFVDESADLTMAQNICFNAKVQRPGVCNAMETMLVHRLVAQAFLPAMAKRFVQAGVDLRGCPVSRQIVPGMQAAGESDWLQEYLSLMLSVKVVADMDEAMDHIAAYSSNHTEAIITSDYERARRFVRRVDSSVVLINASTRFNDGGQLGLGAEIGISTSKLHAFGPMGVKELTTSKFVIFGDGQVRS